MAKPKKGSHSGPHKNHGPKRHLFKDFKPLVHVFGKMGLLTKYNNFESFVLACNARGKKNPTKADFDKFVLLDRKHQDEYLKSLSK